MRAVDTGVARGLIRCRRFTRGRGNAGAVSELATRRPPWLGIGYQPPPQVTSSLAGNRRNRGSEARVLSSAPPATWPDSVGPMAATVRSEERVAVYSKSS
jgi:hypothetical protein